MNKNRIKEIQQETSYPESVSVQQALLKVWNECEQERAVKNKAVLPHDIDMRCPYCKSEDIVWYGLSGDCVCNKCGKEGSIIL